MATKNSSAPKWGAKCLELVREMSFPVVVAPTVKMAIHNPIKKGHSFNSQHVIYPELNAIKT